LRPLIGSTRSSPRYSPTKAVTSSSPKAPPGVFRLPACSRRRGAGSEHFTGTGTLVPAEIADDLRATAPSGYAFFDGARAGLFRRAPRPGEHNTC